MGQRQRYLAARAREQQRRQAALEKQAYYEELERHRQRRLYEEEMARRREQVLREKALERERQERMRRLYEKEMERQRLALERQKAYERKLKVQKQREEMEKASRREAAARARRPIYQIVRGPDGCLYKFLLQPDENESDKYRMDVDAPKCNTPDTSSTSSIDQTSDDSSMSSTEEQEVKKPRNVTVNININAQDLQKKKKSSNTKKTSKKKKAPVIVEDASDSECEDEFADVYHNRRPTSTWIEPVESFNVKTFR